MAIIFVEPSGMGSPPVAREIPGRRRVLSRVGGMVELEWCRGKGWKPMNRSVRSGKVG